MISPAVAINGAFVGQRVTGQQRYAQEMTRELLLRDTVRLLTPPPAVRHRSASTWAWSQMTPALRRRGEWLLTLTSRGPVYAFQHVVTVHDLFVLSNPEWYTKAYVRTHAPVLRRQIRRAAGLIAVSPQTAQAARKLVDPDKRIAIAPNGVRLPGPSAKREPTAGKFILAVASEDPRKNLARLAAAYSALNHRERVLMPLWVIGSANREVFRGAPTQWPDGVRHLGYVPDAELDALYRSARAVVVPSLAEGFGLPVVEAMARGTRVLLSDIPVFRWIADEAATYFDPTSVDDLRETLAREAARDHAERLPRAIVREVVQRFSWPASANSLLDALGSWSEVWSAG